MENNKVSQKLLRLGFMEVDELFKSLNTSDRGLVDGQFEENSEKYGLNEINYTNENTVLKRLCEAFINPFSVVLMTLALVSFLTDYLIVAKEDRSLKTVIIIGIMVTISGVLRFVQEGRSNKAGEKLKAMIKTTATVIRNGSINELPISEIVPGDIIKLAAGDMIPADVRILFAKDLFVSESSMTGESEPVEKQNKLSKEILLKKKVTHLELENLAFMGTNVVSGTAEAIVIATNDTCIGTMAGAITEIREATSFDEGVNFKQD